MKLYEIDEKLSELLARLDPNPETGEVVCDDELLKELEALGMERMRVLTYLAQEVLNTRSDATALKAEEVRLATRRKTLESRTDRLMAILAKECGGEKTDFGVAVGSYRKTTSVEVTDIAAACDYLNEHGLFACIRIKAPEIEKAAVKQLLLSGQDIPGISLAESKSFSLK